MVVLGGRGGALLGPFIQDALFRPKPDGNMNEAGGACAGRIGREVGHWVEGGDAIALDPMASELVVRQGDVILVADEERQQGTPARQLIVRTVDRSEVDGEDELMEEVKVRMRIKVRVVATR